MHPVRLVRFLTNRRSAALFLALICAGSLALRVINLDGPCKGSCTKTSDHSLVFDEVYYVNAARVIAGIPVSDQKHYAGGPAGEDPNAEHPQLGKLLIAASIRTVGDDPWGWRLPSLILGTICILAMYSIARGGGMTKRIALAATAILTFDNLFLVHGRIATLDIMVLAFMLSSCALYLRSYPLTAGVVLGVGACVKLMAPYMLLVFGLVEVFRRVAIWRGQAAATAPSLLRQAVNLAKCTLAGVVVYLGLLTLLDRLIPAYDASTNTVYHDAVAHTLHMWKYAVDLKGSPTGIASYGWQWLLDLKPISYLGLDTPWHVLGHTVQIATTHFLGFINPLIVLLLGPSMILAVVRIVRSGDFPSITSFSWFAGIYVPLLLASVVWNRISYLYYMLLVLPGMCLLAAALLYAGWMPRWLRWTWVGLFLVLGVGLYPFVPVFDPNWA